MSGLIVTEQEAQAVKVGDYLDPARKVRVHSTLTRDGRTVLAWRQRGSKAPGVDVYAANYPVRTYAR